MQLHVLARGEVRVAIAEDGAVVRSLGKGIGRHTDLADLGRGHHTTRHLDPQHERIAALALGVHPDPLQPLLLARHFRDGTRTLLGIGVDDGLSDFEWVPRQLQLLDAVELADIAIRTNELQPAISPTTELHPIGIVEITWH